MATSKPILYSYFMSSCAWRVRIALAYKGIQYEYRAVNLLEKDQNKEDFQKLNPMAQVPALVVDGRPLTQSINIIEFLEETYPENPLLPKSTFDRAKVREISELITSGIQPLQNLSVVRNLKDQDMQEWSQYFNKKGLQALESVLKNCSGKYCVGDAVTMADCCLVPQVFSASMRFNVNMEDFPMTARVYETLCRLPAFEEANPSLQPDAPSVNIL